MKAMVLAAGLGTRLRPLTDSLLEITLGRLRDCGVREVIVNVHHFAEEIVGYLSAKQNFDMRIEISREEVLLDTGGGLKQAAWFFLEDGRNYDEPFLLHNVDVLSNIDLSRMMQFHKEKQALATLAVQPRKSSRYLLFDQQGQLSGRRFEREQRTELARPADPVELLAFCGIHVISPSLLGMMTEGGVFSIIESYLRLAASQGKILAFRADEFYWRDLGTIESLQQAEEDGKRGVFSL
jgi:mannose-1-phosphate guanylyltransferase